MFWMNRECVPNSTQTHQLESVRVMTEHKIWDWGDGGKSVYAYGYYYYTFVHTCYSIYTDTLGILYTVHLCLSVSCSHENPASSLAAPATEFALIYPHSARSITSVSFHHLILISLLTLPLSFSILTPAVIKCFILTQPPHFPPICHPSHFEPTFTKFFSGFLFIPFSWSATQSRSAHSPVSLLTLCLPTNATYDEQAHLSHENVRPGRYGREKNPILPHFRENICKLPPQLPVPGCLCACVILSMRTTMLFIW